MKTSPFFISIAVVLFVGTPFILQALGVSVRPSAFSLEGEVGKEKGTTMVVSNPSNEVALFEVYPEEFTSRFSIVPARFVLESGTSREVLVKISSREEERFTTELAVEAHSLLGPESMVLGGGVRIPVSVSILPASRTLLGAVGAAGITLGAAGVLAGVLFLLLWWVIEKGRRRIRVARG